MAEGGEVRTEAEVLGLNGLNNFRLLAQLLSPCFVPGTKRGVFLYNIIVWILMTTLGKKRFAACGFADEEKLRRG